MGLDAISNCYNKVVIEYRVKQFWSENHTCNFKSNERANFEITRMIPDQIALHSVQLPL